MGDGGKAAGPRPNGGSKPKKEPRVRFNVRVPTEIHAMSSDQALPILCDIFKGRALVSFSGGKDAVGCVLALKAAGFDDLHLYHMYTLPNLRIMEEALSYYEALWETRITRVQGPLVQGSLEDFGWQPWHRIPLIGRWGPAPELTFDEVSREVRRDLGWTKETPTVVGIRMDDSIFRATALRKSGAYMRSRNVVYPIFDWSRARLRDTLIATQTRLAPDYRIMGRSFSGDGLDYRFLKPLADHYPDDYQRVLRMWPCVSSELARYEFARRAAEKATHRTSGFTL